MWAAVLLLFLALGQSSVLAVDSAFLEGGSGHEGELVRLGIAWDLGKREIARGRWSLAVSLEADLGSWRPDLGDDGLWEAGVTPVLRIAPESSRPRRLTPFLEAAVGVHLLSNVRFGGLDLSTSFQFGSHIGAGVAFGKNRRFSLVYRYQHLSNASVKQPNPGIEFHLLQLGYRFAPGH